MFFPEKWEHSFVYWMLENQIIFDPVKTSADFPHGNLGLPCVGRIHHVVGRLICLGVYVSGDSFARTQGCSYHSNRVTGFSPGIGPATTHHCIPFSVSHSLRSCDNRNTCFCPSEQQRHFPKCHLLGDMPNVPLAAHFPVCKMWGTWETHNTPFVVGFCIAGNERTTLNKPVFLFISHSFYISL